METWPTDAKDDNAEGGSPTVFVVDDDSSVRTALDSLLRSVGVQVQSFCSPDEFLKSEIPEEVPGCIVLDVRFPGQSGFHLQSEINRMEFPIPIVFLTGYADTKMTVKAMKAGAIDFLNKPFREEDMLDAIAQAINCHRERLNMAKNVKQVRVRYDLLTPREREVFAYVAAGLLNKQIAKELDISEYTVKIHRKNAMEKMGATNVVDLIHQAMTLGLPIHTAQPKATPGRDKLLCEAGNGKEYDCALE
ncbi:response regulator [Paraburkholderia edwinii]|jgi:FixJ family two-component response regulator|uniref:Response regulator n=1 Tax=Paraburkholderia edwinii TaxID=2861782 RepID=A0ABX8UWC6_9BURK|nr:response regulator [Paraburkholderia edwinii]QYD71540.1 response regulator [Paraburkholderia edwinii]